RRIEREPAVEPESDEKLWVGPTGNDVRDFSSSTPFQLVRERAAAIRTPEHAAGLEALLGLDRLLANLPAAVVGRVPSRDIEVEAMEVPSAAGVWVPAWVFVPKSRSTGVFLSLDVHGLNEHWRVVGVGEGPA